MAGRATYTEQDKARVYVVLTANDGNVKRTARETNVPETTVSRWKSEFEKNGPPDTEAIQVAASQFLGDAERVRYKALLEIERLIDAREARVNELNNVMGTLTDKIDRAKGLDVRRVEHQHHLPPSDEIREALLGFISASHALSRARDEEIEDAEIVEQASLPAGK